MKQYVLIDKYILRLILIILIAAGILYICTNNNKTLEVFSNKKLSMKPNNKPYNATLDNRKATPPNTLSPASTPIQQLNIQQPPLSNGTPKPSPPRPSPTPPPLPSTFIHPNKKGNGSLLCPASTIIIFDS